MASEREKYKVVNSLICLLKAVEGKITTLELRNENTVAGKVVHVDGFMNVTMTDVIFRNYKGKVTRLAEFFVHGKIIRYVQIPDEIDMKKAIEKEANVFIERKKEIRQEITKAAKLKIQRKQKMYAEKMRKESLKKLTKSVDIVASSSVPCVKSSEKN